MKKRGILCFFLLALLTLLLSGCSRRAETAEEDAGVDAETGGRMESAAETAPEPTSVPTPEPTPDPTPEPTPVVPAKKMDIQVVWRSMPCPELTDGTYTEAKSFMPQEDVTVTAKDGEISALYLLWDDTSPKPWTLRSGDEEIACGQNGFQHEFIELSSPSPEVVITLPEGNPYVRIAEIYAFTEGALPEWVQVWQPPCEQADILLFPTHSDDEFVFFGGVIPASLAEGWRVQVAYMVNHHQSARFRCHEQLDSLWTAGARNYPIINDQPDVYKDSVEGARQFYGEEHITEYQVEQIRRFQPLVIVGHDEAGDSGHVAHVLNTLCLKQAVELAADESVFPDSAACYGVWDTPKLYLHLYGEEYTVLDFETPLALFDGRTAFQVAQDAFAMCVSQYQNGYGKYTVFGSDSPYDTHLFGLYRTLVGEDTEKNDLFEHIDPAAFR